MKTKRIHGRLGAIGLALAVFWAGTVSAQTFSSGSTGADGAFTPSCAPTPCTVTVALPASGVFNYTTVDIPAGVTVTFTRNAANTPVTILATGNVTIAGTLSVNGTKGTDGATSGPAFNPGALGGPGGFTGGQGGSRDGLLLPSAGQGPGGGPPQGGPSFANGNYGAPTSFVSLLPLFGGSGGGGGTRASSFSGTSGAGGGGALVIASSTQIAVTGFVRANGGDAGLIAGSITQGPGSGGAIRLVAPQISGAGTLQANGGAGVMVGGAGRIRLEAFTLGFTGASSPAASLSTAPGPVTAAGTPALVNLPTLTISAVGGVASPVTSGGSYTTADVALPTGTTNPVPVTLTITNTPVGTVFTVRLLPQFGNATSVNSTASSGTFATSTSTANVTFPTGEVSVLNAFGSFTLPTQTAALFPLIDGEPVDRIMVAATYGEPSTVTLMTKSGKEVRADHLPPGEQVAVARAFGALRMTN